MAKKDNFWIESNVKILTDMWNKGETAADIAEVLGSGVTRNAVIGKANRLGLEKRPSPIKKTTSVKKDKELRKDKMIKEAVNKANTNSDKFSILDIKEGMCRWPSGDPKDDDFHFCGKKAVEGCPYCENHASEAYQVPTKKN